MMKRYNFILGLSLIATMSACTDWLQEPTPGVTKLEDYFQSAAAATSSVTAAYQPLIYEYNNTYISEWFIGDIVSDDALKGGQGSAPTSDMGDVYDFENWRTASNSGFLLQTYRALYLGISRTNTAIDCVSSMEAIEDLTDETKAALIAEAKFLRAYYYFRLVRIFGGVPIIDFVARDDSKWILTRSSVDEVYAFIKADLEEAESLLPKKWDDNNVGRATKGAAQAMLLKVNLYTKDFAKAAEWGKKVIESGSYSLCPRYQDNFTIAGENGPESVFEYQYRNEPSSDYGEGFGSQLGSFTLVLCRPRSGDKVVNGWGFNHPTQNLYDEFEDGDVRRDWTIVDFTAAGMETNVDMSYYGNTYTNRKYAMFDSEDPLNYKQEGGSTETFHDSRGPLNNRQIRYSDVLLMYAEACAENGNDAEAINALNQVRERVNMPTYPGYTFKVNGTEITSPTLMQAIRHERRVELAMEGHRWFDLCRWNGVDGKGVKAHMEAYQATESGAVQSQIQEFVAGKHELFPIPFEEIDLNPALTQNPGY